MRGVTATRLPSPRGNPDDALRTRPFGGPARTDSAPHDNDASELRVQDLDLNLLKTFRAVYEERHVGRAALRLGVTQPSVSYALGRLRLMFRDALFVRTGTGVEPTPRAQRLALSVDKALAILQDVLDEGSRFTPDSTQRVFRLHMSDFAASAFLPTLLAAFDPRAGRGDRDAARRRMPAQRRTRIGAHRLRARAFRRCVEPLPAHRAAARALRAADAASHRAARRATRRLRARWRRARHAARRRGHVASAIDAVAGTARADAARRSPISWWCPRCCRTATMR